MKTGEPHILVQDEDFDWFLIPKALEDQFYEWDEWMAKGGKEPVNCPNFELFAIDGYESIQIFAWTEE